ncbi:MAG: hypothetical protein QOC85_494, partial [Streptomyces sp.]|nr:hypothetical protein [Streptomyces sp.]
HLNPRRPRTLVAAIGERITRKVLEPEQKSAATAAG